MAIGVDTSKWKPRKVKGTPAYIFRNRLARAVAGTGVLIGLALHFSGFSENLRKQFDKLYTDPIEEVERKEIIANFTGVRSGSALRRKMEEEDRIDLPHK
ncbi:hypothetical protein EVAR_84694_1 [Eumeta japonica]|uniref:Uncharacterized protein n=1 Tax=Eumeta variegata TaxID=151549 RepID=A0A4C1VRQ7_EUMVA|nr:hypothetical protein EVAR_84694_1 [Eumeta japonica]